jgi:hypothetical protein
MGRKINCQTECRHLLRHWETPDTTTHVAVRLIRFFTFKVLLLSATGLPLSVAAQTEPDIPVCAGFNPDSPQSPWAPVGTVSAEILEGNCPADHAIFSVVPPAGMRRSGDRINIYATCCPLPKGILTGTHLYELLECPNGYVATGAKQEALITDELQLYADRKSPKYWAHARRQYLRCTQINSARYVLGTRLHGTHVGFESGFRTTFDAKAARSSIPLALRFGIGRLDRGRWSPGSCLGIPWGSLLTGKKSKYCSDFEFRQLQYSGAAGDPAQGTPVQVYPNCLAIRNPLSRKPICVAAGKE